ncbi:MAG TPA: hypothetical protein VF042_14265 [Gemmatimonadaceae bacterium]
MNESRRLLQHFLAALAYRTQKALRGAPADFSEFCAGNRVRTPHELIWHMTGLMGYARTYFHGGVFGPDEAPRLDTFAHEVERFHQTLTLLAHDFSNPSLTARISDQQFLQGPLADAMTHAGQLAMLRRLHGEPVASENFIFAQISPENLSSNQPPPAAPDRNWTPESGHQPPGAGKS